MSKWDTPREKSIVDSTIEALKKNNINTMFVETGEEAKEKVLELLPKGAEVFDATSVTLQQIGIPEVINNSGEYDSVREKLNKMERGTQHLEMQKLGAAPEYVVGSVHAVTEDGKILVASNTGSQLPAYAYGSTHVIWVVGTNKIAKNLDEAMERLYDHILPLESERLNKAYNITTGSFVSKLLIFNREIHQHRITLIFVNEVLGF